MPAYRAFRGRRCSVWSALLSDDTCLCSLWCQMPTDSQKRNISPVGTFVNISRFFLLAGGGGIREGVRVDGSVVEPDSGVPPTSLGTSLPRN